MAKGRDSLLAHAASGEWLMSAMFAQLARYNRWANARLYEAALALDEGIYRGDVGAFFKSMHGTLNHLLVTDRIWLTRLTGEGQSPNRLDTILYDDRRALCLARADHDDRIVRLVDGLDDAALEGLLAYATTSGKCFEQRRREILTHLFNHQTHHRGQAHMILSICTGREPPALDLLLMQRGITAPDLRSLAAVSAA
jgi:uncharacterized damage-inducible protein DinB